MKKLNKSEGIAVFAGIALLTYVFFSGPLLALFTNQPNPEKKMDTQAPQGGLVKEDVVIGTGAVAAAGDKITAHYVGHLTNGQVFDSSRDRNVPIQFTLGTGQVIKGWDEGIVGMREGGKRILKIAPDYGYGSRAIGAIPANSTLIFEVELVKVERPQ
jgi:FKBP-type peptidyl-prolyl cis-trans isomerase